MRLNGVHHVTCITGDAPANVNFYAGTLGLRLVKKTVNQDDPTVYHLFYADENGSAGADITFFEYPGAASGRAGTGMVHTVVWRVGSAEALDFWAERLGVERDGDRFETRGDSRGGWIEYGPAPAERGIPGAGTVHHVAWASTMEDEEAWQKRVAEAGGRPTPIIDRFWFLSIYFREPSGVLFEIATLGPGFAADEDPEHLGETLVLPPAFEHLRAQVEPILTPLPNPREAWTRT